MIRRDFLKTPLALAGLTMGNPDDELSPSPQASAGQVPTAPGLTRFVAAFIVNTKYEDIPEDVIALGKKTLLDGFGLALAGSASVPAAIVLQYLATLGTTAKTSPVIAPAVKVPRRFAAFANGMS